MRKLFGALQMILFLPVVLKAQTSSDNIIRGVKIEFNYSPSIFPDPWLTGAINARGEAIDQAQIDRTKLVMTKALAKYPQKLLQLNLTTVYFLKYMSMYDVGFGGTNSTDAVYLTNNGADQGYTDEYLEQTFHHEFSSILFRNYPSFLDTIAWKAVNTEGFDYNDPEEGVGAIRENKSSQDLDTALCRVGFLTQYAYSGMENDVNTIAQNLFKPAPGFWDIVNTYPRIREKVRLLVEFYGKLSPGFNQRFFTKMNNQ